MGHKFVGKLREKLEKEVSVVFGTQVTAPSGQSAKPAKQQNHYPPSAEGALWRRAPLRAHLTFAAILAIARRLRLPCITS